MTFKGTWILAACWRFVLSVNIAQLLVYVTKIRNRVLLHTVRKMKKCPRWTSYLNVTKLCPARVKVIGFEEEHRGMWALIVSVVLHKSLISFSLGLSAFNVFLYIRNVVYVILIFVTSSPVGALLGALLKELLSHQQKTDIIIGIGD